ncbi:MAG: GNAT family N-acetyltransferase [Polyangiaceae bacterium]
MPAVTLRSVESRESALVFSFLTLAARMAESNEPIQKALVDEQLTKYWHGWGRPGDLGIVAIRELDALPVCCAWLRQLPTADEGFIAPGVLELAFGTIPSDRGQGIGSETLAQLIAECRERAVAGISLSVRAENPAVRLYQRLGFETIEEIVNRVGTKSLVMKLDLARS